MKTSYLMEIQTRPGERSWEVDILTMPWVSLRRLESDVGVEIQPSAYRQKASTIHWIATDADPPSLLRLHIRSLPSISQGIVVACITALGTLGVAYLGYLSQLRGSELDSCRSTVKGKEDEVNRCREDANLREHLEMTMGVLPVEQGRCGGTP